MAGFIGTTAMKRAAKFREMVVRAVQQKSGEMLREQIPLCDMSDCLLAVYDEVSRRAFQRCIVRGAQEGSDKEDWKAAEDDLFARISVDFEESGGNLYALASLPGCAGTEITVAMDECWLLIAGHVESSPRENAEEDFGDYTMEAFGGDTGSGESAKGLAVIRSRESCGLREIHEQRESPQRECDEREAEQRVPILRAPRPFCVVALRAKVGPERSVAVLSNGLLAIRMGKAGLETPVPRVA
jgi:HSP20 family molecular chaperone IbpA